MLEDRAVLRRNFHKAFAMRFHLQEERDIGERAEEIISACVEKKNAVIFLEIKESGLNMALLHIESLQNGAEENETQATNLAISLNPAHDLSGILPGS